MCDLTAFQCDVPQTALNALQDRLARTRLPDAETVAGSSQGVPLAEPRAVLDHWRSRHGWRAIERRLNGFDQFHTKIDGVTIHFIHARSSHSEALPVLLTHGWPGSVLEFIDVIDPLRAPASHGGNAADAFHLVVPSLPGFGFSGAPREPGWGARRVARAWATLMARLGYRRWVAQGGDWGSEVTHRLAQLAPAGLLAAHVTWPFVAPDTPLADPTEAERQTLADLARFRGDGGGYFHQQSTRPQTIGYALADSPFGLAMWLYEKFRDWADPRHPISLDRILDHASLYWLTGTSASAARFYWETAKEGGGASAGSIALPMAASLFPHELWRAPRAWADALWPRLFYWNELDRGGHFAALEQPTVFVEELRAAFRPVRGW